MNNILADIKSSKPKNKLKKTDTRVTHKDGKVFIAQKADDGKIKEEYKETVDLSDYLEKKKLSKDDIKQHDEFVTSFDIEHWYPDIKHITFDTYFIALSIQNAEIMTKISTQYDSGKKTDEWIQQQIKNDHSLTLICNKMHQVMTQNNMNNNGCFCKLSSRSPKDATFEKLKDIFNSKIMQLKQASINYDLNQCVQILVESGFQSMKCINATQCLLNIVKSKRCYEDLTIALKYKDIQFKQNIIIRPWIDIAAKNEFRAFIFENTFVAMSQYNYIARFDDVITHKNMIQETIVKFWNNKCKDILSKQYDKYIIDFAIIQKGTTEFKIADVLVIELNPYENDTDSLLFDWKSKKDKDTLNGKTQFEFRVQMKAFHPEEMWRLLPTHRSLVDAAIKIQQ